MYPPTTAALSACRAAGCAGTSDCIHAHVGMWTKVRAVGAGPGNVATLPMVHAAVNAAASGAPVGNGGVVSIPGGGVGGGASPARYGALKVKLAPTQLPPNGATGCASSHDPRVRRNAVTATT